MSVDNPTGDSQAEFGAFLVARGALPQAALDRARRLQAEMSERLGTVLTRLGLIAERDLADALSAFTGAPVITAAAFPERPILADRLSAKFLRQASIVPLAEGADGLVLAMADPLDREAIEAVRYAAETPILPRVALASDLARALDRLYGASAPTSEQIVAGLDSAGFDAKAEDTERLKDLASEAPVIRLVNLWIERAVEARASDIHIEAAENVLTVRFRIDGALRPVEETPAGLGPAVSSRIKIMARLDIAERRLPQDGKFRVAVQGKEIDFRVSIVPSVHGESIVLRILDRSQVALDFAALGYDGAVLERYRAILQRPHGILLVTGPTGSGKTTTLYTSLLHVCTPDLKILTVEDPVEYQLAGVTQVQVHPQIGLNFAGALRAFLRHDPDVILVGEIRDVETARIAVQAALTGHLVLSTLHTNDAASAITRLLDMGVEDYLITATVNGIAAQRLVRRLCPQCRVPYAVTPDVAARLKLDAPAPITLFKPGGCAACGGNGFAGRTTVAEVLAMTEALKDLVIRRAGADAMQRQAEADGMASMYRDGLRKCLAGLTTVDEVLRVTATS